MIAAPPDPNFKLNANGVPDFDSLPLRPGDPHLSAWGLYGASDELGFLNRQTNDRVAKAAQTEIRTAVRIGLNWPMGAQKDGAFFDRKIFHQRMFNKVPRTVNDDEWIFNSQVSSQWDGLRHFGYQKEKLFYNGVTMENIHSCTSHGAPSTTNAIHAWVERGIVGRAILVDFESWRVANGKPFDHFATTPITLQDMLDCLAAQDSTVPCFSDVLLIRSGWMVALAQKPAGELADRRATHPHTFCGVEQSKEVLRWIWDNFSAVAGDQPSFECWPTRRDWLLHEVLLAGWGCPIGELFDLERLAEHCKKERRWSFFVASEPCNVTGGVASPPKILAIF